MINYGVGLGNNGSRYSFGSKTKEIYGTCQTEQELQKVANEHGTIWVIDKSSRASMLTVKYIAGKESI